MGGLEVFYGEFIGVVDGEMLRDMKEASASPRMLRMSEWDLDRQDRSEKLFSLLQRCFETASSVASRSCRQQRVRSMAYLVS